MQEMVKTASRREEEALGIRDDMTYQLRPIRQQPNESNLGTGHQMVEHTPWGHLKSIRICKCPCSIGSNPHQPPQNARNSTNAIAQPISLFKHISCPKLLVSNTID